MAWLPQEIDVPDAWAAAGYRALGRLRMSGGAAGPTTWDQLVDAAGERLLSIPVDAPGALLTLTSPLAAGVAAVTTGGGPSGLLGHVMWADHPASGLFHAQAPDRSPAAMSGTHDALLRRAGAALAPAGRHEWRQAQRRIQSRTLDWAAASSHGVRHRFWVALATVGPLLAAYTTKSIMRARDGGAGHALPAAAWGLSAPVALLLISVAAVGVQRAYVWRAARRLARSGPLPRVPPPSE